jgi:prophage tail gpP-like protein
MATSHTVRLGLRATGTELTVYDRYDVVRDMMEPGSPWTFSLWRHNAAFTRELNPRDRETAWDTLMGEARCGGIVDLEIDGALQLTGRIESREVVNQGRQGACLVLSGRDLAGPALDWDADPTIALRGADLDTVLGRLFATLQIGLVFDQAQDAVRLATGRPRSLRGTAAARPRRRSRVDAAHPKPGEKVWGLAESIARKQGLMLWVAPTHATDLSVIVGRPDYAQAPWASLRCDEWAPDVPAAGNVLTSRCGVQTRDVPTEVLLLGGTARGDARATAYRAQSVNTALLDLAEVDSELSPQRRWVQAPRARTPAQAQRECLRVIADAMVKCRTYEATVQGHGSADRLYTTDAVLAVRDQVCEVNESLYCHRIEFHGSRRDGQTTTLRCHPLHVLTAALDAAADAEE